MPVYAHIPCLVSVCSFLFTVDWPQDDVRADPRRVGEAKAPGESRRAWIRPVDDTRDHVRQHGSGAEKKKRWTQV